MTQDLDAQIAQHQRLLVHLRAELQRLRTQFVSQTGRAVADWYLSRARELVTREPEVSRSLAPGELNDLKRSVEQLASQAPERAQRVLSASEFWWDQYDSPPAYMGKSGRHSNVPDCYIIEDERDPHVLSQVLRELMNELSPFLHAKGFLRATGSGFRDAATAWMTWPDDARATMAQYVKKIAITQHIISELIRLQRLRDRNAVGDLWDSL